MHARRSIWYFGALLLLGALAVAIPLVVNLGQQLTPERLQAARALWRERGPHDYDLEYWQSVTDPKQASAHEPRIDEFQVAVRHGKVTAARCNGALTDEPVQTIDSMFDVIEKNLADDAAARKWNFTTTDFDSTDGHPRRYVHRVPSTGERIEWRIRLKSPGS